MKIKELSINNLRNHKITRITLNPGLNVFFGMNGAGKTTILEGVSLTAFSKSFLSTPDNTLINKNEDAFFVSAACETDIGTPYKCSIKLVSGKRKEINSTLGDNLTPKDIIGEIPTVILSPDFKSITFGSPENRRSFIDRTLSQTSRLYYEELVKLKRTLKQRNALLAKAKSEYCFDKSLILPWTEQFIKTSAEIIIRRDRFINGFIPYFKMLYEEVSSGREQAGLVYEPDSINYKDNISKEDIIDQYNELAKNLLSEEIRRGTTLLGPQKDDVKVLINGFSAKDYASQGQHKSLLISIKFAEFQYLKSKRNETPVILLDDIFSELDAKRSSKVFNLIHQNNAQSLITVTDAGLVHSMIPKDTDVSFFRVEDGNVDITNCV